METTAQAEVPGHTDTDSCENGGTVTCCQVSHPSLCIEAISSQLIGHQVTLAGDVYTFQFLADLVSKTALKGYKLNENDVNCIGGEAKRVRYPLVNSSS